MLEINQHSGLLLLTAGVLFAKQTVLFDMTISQLVLHKIII